MEAIFICVNKKVIEINKPHLFRALVQAPNVKKRRSSTSIQTKIEQDKRIEKLTSYL